MQTDTADLGEVRRKLQEAVWADLGSKRYKDVSVEAAAQDLLIDPVDARLATNGKMELILSQLSDMDRDAAATSSADFRDDPDASMHEKLLEGLLHRFDVYQPYKTQIRHLHEAGIADPVLALKLIKRLSKSMDMLLAICGDTNTSLQRDVRVKGLTALVMSVRSEWMNDENTDLAKTTKLLDKRLKQAAEWAQSFRIL